MTGQYVDFCLKTNAAQPRSQSSLAISDVTSPVKLVGKIWFQASSDNSDRARWLGYEAERCSGQWTWSFKQFDQFAAQYSGFRTNYKLKLCNCCHYFFPSCYTCLKSRLATFLQRPDSTLMRKFKQETCKTSLHPRKKGVKTVCRLKHWQGYVIIIWIMIFYFTEYLTLLSSRQSVPEEGSVMVYAFQTCLIKI